MQIFYYLPINIMVLYMGPQVYANLQIYYQASHLKYMKWLLCRMTNIISMMMMIIIIIIKNKKIKC